MSKMTTQRAIEVLKNIKKRTNLMSYLSLAVQAEVEALDKAIEVMEYIMTDKHGE